ncbi:MAG: hypothetical protein K0Q52_1120 [Microbacterium sp.]|jgi:hypothetical protein|nr:hypothetical protein [Microbacterium sp.]
MPDLEPDWWCLIDKRAALREQFPPLSKVRNERPGCAADIERKRLFREEAELAKAREHDARWRRSCEENARRRRRQDARRNNAEYRQYREERRTA